MGPTEREGRGEGEMKGTDAGVKAARLHPGPTPHRRVLGLELLQGLQLRWRVTATYMCVAPYR